MSFLPDLRVVLRSRDFRRLYATRLTSQAADGVFQVALASFVFFNPEKATDKYDVAATFATLLLPYSLVGPFAGVLIDRWQRQRILVVGNAIRAVMVLGVAALTAAGTTGIPFYASVLAVLSVNRFYLSSLSASLPHVVPAHELVMGNSVSTTSGTLAALVGGGIGYGVRTLAGADASGSAVVMAVAMLTYLAAAAVARTMHRDLLGPDFDEEHPETREALRHVLRGIADGARHVRHHDRAGRALAAIGAHRFFYGISTITTILVYRNYFSSGAADQGLGGLALVFAASAVGVFAAAVITPQVTHRISEEAWVCSLFAGAAVVEVALGMPYRQETFVVAALLLGGVAQGSKICVDTLVQRSIDDAYRGRVFSFYDILFNVSFVSAAAFAALAVPDNGKSYPVLGVIAAGYALTGGAYWSAARRAARRAAEPGSSVRPTAGPARS